MNTTSEILIFKYSGIGRRFVFRVYNNCESYPEIMNTFFTKIVGFDGFLILNNNSFHTIVLVCIMPGSSNLWGKKSLF